MGVAEVLRNKIVEAKDLEPAMLCAASEGFDEIVGTLIAKNADINAKSRDGDTVLYCAVNTWHTKRPDVERQHLMQRKKQIVDTLIMKKANVNAAHCHGYTP